MADNNLCKQHSGFLARIETLETNVHELWKNWNGQQKMIIGTLISALLSFTGVAYLIIRSMS